MSRFTLRLPETLHNELEARAQQEGVSLNQYIVYTLAKQIAPTYTVQMLPQENIREQREQFQEFLKGLGKPSLAEAKAFLAGPEPAELEEGLSEEIVYHVKEKIAATKTTR